MTPWTLARQAPLSMQFPRQEYWSQLPFSSPNPFLPHPKPHPHPEAIPKRPRAKLLQSCPILCNPMDRSPPDSSVHRILLARILKFHFLLQGIFPTQGLNLFLLHLLQDSLPLVPPGKLKNIGVGSLSPGNLPNPGTEPGSLALRRILYQLSYIKSTK